MRTQDVATRRRRLVALAAALLAIVALLLWRHESRPRRADRPRVVQERPPIDSAPVAWRPVLLSPATFAHDPTAPLGLFAGRVLSRQSGVGVAGATLTFLHGGALATVSSDGSGGFQLRPWEGGRYELVAVEASGYVAFSQALGQSGIVFDAEPGIAITDIALYLEPAEGTALTGIVVDPSGRPLAGATVLALAPPSTERWTSDDHGEFRFRAAEGALLMARHAGFAPARAVLDPNAVAARRLVLRLGSGDDQPFPSGRIAGQVRDASGGPLANALVVANALPATDYPRGEAVTDSRGHFAIDDLDAGSYAVTADLPPLAPMTEPRVATGTSDLLLVLDDGGAIRGTVRDPSGAPVTAFELFCARKQGPIARKEERAAAVFDADGRYEVDGLEPGDYFVTATAPSFGPAPEQATTVTAGGVAEIDLTLSRGARLTGRLVEAGSGTPLPGASVVAEGSPGDRGSSVAPASVQAVAGTDGRFLLAGLPPNVLFSVMATAAGHNGRIVPRLEAAADGDAGPITIELSPTQPGEDPHTQLTGIGAQLAPSGDALVIQALLPGGGAAQAGLLPGDAILAVDGQSVAALGFVGAIQVIRGPEGTTVELAVRRAADGSVATIAVARLQVG